MAADLNRVTLVGRLTRDPELRHTAGGDGVCSMRLAVSSRSRDEQGQWAGPAFYNLSTASVGFQIGVEVAEVVIMVMTDKGAEYIGEPQRKIVLIQGQCKTPSF